MKRLLTPLFAGFVCCAATAQPPVSNARSFQENAAYRKALTNYLGKEKTESDTSVVGPDKPYYLVNPKPGLHRLPKDNMPCIVPDSDATVSIPNAWQGETTIPFRGRAPRIPNQSKRLKIAPSRPLLIFPQKNNDTK